MYSSRTKGSLKYEWKTEALSVFAIVGFFWRNRLNDQFRNNNSFYAPPVNFAQRIGASDKYSDAGNSKMKKENDFRQSLIQTRIFWKDQKMKLCTNL